jgi:hypothetical protein
MTYPNPLALLWEDICIPSPRRQDDPLSMHPPEPLHSLKAPEFPQLHQLIITCTVVYKLVWPLLKEYSKTSTPCMTKTEIKIITHRKVFSF